MKLNDLKETNAQSCAATSSFAAVAASDALRLVHTKTKEVSEENEFQGQRNREERERINKSITASRDLGATRIMSIMV